MYVSGIHYSEGHLIPNHKKLTLLYLNRVKDLNPIVSESGQLLRLALDPSESSVTLKQIGSRGCLTGEVCSSASIIPAPFLLFPDIYLSRSVRHYSRQGKSLIPGKARKKRGSYAFRFMVEPEQKRGVASQKSGLWADSRREPGADIVAVHL